MTNEFQCQGQCGALLGQMVKSYVWCTEETYILDAADDAGLDLPYSCRSGTCSSCAAKIVSGELDQTEQQFLDEDAIGKGYALICVSILPQTQSC